MSTSINAPYHHGNLRRALLEAALIILEREGEAGLGLRDLARAVGVSAAAPYRHFDGRAALLEALAVTGFQRFTAAMEAIPLANPPDLMAAMGKTYVLFALDNANLFRLMFSPQLKRTAAPACAWPPTRRSKPCAISAVATPRPAASPRSRPWARVHGLAVLLLDGQIAIRAGEDTEALIAEIVRTSLRLAPAILPV
ncbi:TetR/AcrR family transcriptional regulator [Devosia sp. A8/3-2]|nr:TetR/AcrR family transcriptional regulator [Devosia sp. A8/3-2]